VEAGTRTDRPVAADIAARGGADPAAAGSCLVCGASLTGARSIETPDRKGIAPGRYRISVCPSCGGGTTTPRVPAADLGQYYESADYGPHVSGGYMSPLFRFAMRTRLRTTRLFAPLRGARPGTLLDVGCGRGDLGAALLERGWAVSGLDASERACEEARRRGVSADLGTVEDAKLPDAGFDAIVFHHSLEHVVDPVQTLTAARHALRPGGRALISVPNFGSNRARRHGEDWWLLELPRHRFHFTARSVAIAVETAGLELESCRESAAMLGTAASLQQRTIGDFLEAGPLFLAGYALTVLAFPVGWASNELRGGGELLNVVARRPAEPLGSGDGRG